jgi:HrpA-like RNA helicase
LSPTLAITTAILLQALDPPDEAAIDRAMSTLIRMGAVATGPSGGGDGTGNGRSGSHGKHSSSSNGTRRGEQGSFDAPAETMTAMGHRLSQLPLRPALAKALLMACVLDCAPPLLSIVACLGDRDIFMPVPLHLRTEADLRRKSLVSGAGYADYQGSDHLLMLAAYEQWYVYGVWRMVYV